MLLPYPFQQYLSYITKAKDQHGIHSPFVFELYTKIIRPFKWYYLFDEIEAYREQLLQEQQIIEVRDLGAGSHKLKSVRRSIRQIAQTSLSKPAIGQLLFKLIEHFSPSLLLELGTSLGINTLYLANVSKKAKVLTFEGCPSIAQRAQQTFQDNHADNVELIEGNLDETLPKVLSTIPTVDFVYFDANHRYEPTIRYVECCLAKIHDNSFFALGDIHWSPEMTAAWETIKQYEQVTVSIDLFELGLLFFHKKQAKQHFVLKF